MLVDIRPPPEPYPLLQAWHPLVYTMMVDCYATCKPVHFDLRFVDSSNKEKRVLSRNNLLSILQAIEPENIPSAVSKVYPLFGHRNAFWNNLNDKHCLIWKHVDCDCDHDINERQRRWEWRPPPQITSNFLTWLPKNAQEAITN